MVQDVTIPSTSPAGWSGNVSFTSSSLWRRVTGRMVVEHDDGRRAGNRRLSKHFSRRRRRRIERAARDELRLNKPQLHVEQQRAEPLDRRRAELRQHERRHVVGPRNRSAPVARASASAGPARCWPARGQRAPGRPRHLRQPRHAHRRQPVDAAGRREQAGGDRQRALPARAPTKHERQELVVAEGADAAAVELLSRESFPSAREDMPSYPWGSASVAKTGADSPRPQSGNPRNRRNGDPVLRLSRSPPSLCELFGERQA